MQTAAANASHPGQQGMPAVVSDPLAAVALVGPLPAYPLPAAPWESILIR